MAVVAPRVFRRIAERIVAECDPEQVILFGSHAKGSAGQESDIDVLVLIDRDNEDLRRCQRAIEQALDQLPVKIDVVARRSRDGSDAIDRPHSFLGSVLASGVPLYRRTEGYLALASPIDS